MRSSRSTLVVPFVLGIVSLLQIQITNLSQLGRNFQISAAFETHTHEPPPHGRQQELQTSHRDPKLGQRHRKWAYAFLMAGVDINNPGYRGILYNVLISADILKDSNADIIVMVQMADTTNATTLPSSEEELLRKMNVTIHYLDLPPRQNFYSIQYEKFHILDLTDYSRVMFMDGDVMPYCSMDYIFELSDPREDGIHSQTLKENVIIAWSQEPAHGGLFMLEPKVGDHQLLDAVIATMERSKTFDRVTGWGHVITAPDHWHSISGREGPNATLWEWHGDFADQGLLYYWTKYYKKSVSIVIKDRIENWSSRNDGEAFLEEVLPNGFLAPHSCLPDEYTMRGKYAKSRFNPRYVPLRDFRHFSGTSKPWRQGNDVDWNKTYTFEDVKDTDARHYWLYMLRRLNDELGLGVDVSNLNIPEAPYGTNPTKQMVRHVKKARRTQGVSGQEPIHGRPKR